MSFDAPTAASAGRSPARAGATAPAGIPAPAKPAAAGGRHSSPRSVYSSLEAYNPYPSEPFPDPKLHPAIAAAAAAYRDAHAASPRAPAAMRGRTPSPQPGGASFRPKSETHGYWSASPRAEPQPRGAPKPAATPAAAARTARPHSARATPERAAPAGTPSALLYSARSARSGDGGRPVSFPDDRGRAAGAAWL